MANPFAGTTTLSSAGVSVPIGLDPTARVTAILLGLSNLVLNSTSLVGTSQDVTIQGTLDPWTPSGPAPTWTNLSTTHYSSASAATLITFTGPLAGLRLASSTFTPGTNNISVTLKALQAITAGP
jgi:hypothetical protein